MHVFAAPVDDFLNENRSTGSFNGTDNVVCRDRQATDVWLTDRSIKSRQIGMVNKRYSIWRQDPENFRDIGLNNFKIDMHEGVEREHKIAGINLDSG